MKFAIEPHLTKNLATVTLEAALLKRPMVVAYKLASLTWWLAQRLVKTEHVALPNLLASKPRIPELIQQQANPAALATAILELFSNDKAAEQTSEFLAIHKTLRQDASSRAAEAVLDLVNH